MARTKGAKDLKPRKKTLKPIPHVIDWEKLAKDLQRALAMEIKENDELKQQVTNANQLVIKMSGVIEYLEMKRGHNPV